jgi:hypothetical protein
MAQRQCYHCKEPIDEGAAHDCWTTTESALTADMPEDLLDAYARIRETATSFGEQRIYASHHCIMFSRTACYFFVRPKRHVLELCIFLGRTLRAPQIRRSTPASARKVAHLIRISHRDEVEPPITEWLREAYEVSDTLSARRTARTSDAPSATGGTARNRSRGGRPAQP